LTIPISVELPLSHSDPRYYQRVQGVLWRILVMNLLIALIKLLTGIATGALAMTADGIHSLIDTSANLLGIIGAAIAGRPPDDDHPYGHRRFETLSTLAIGGLLIVAAWEILKTGLDHLLSATATTATPVSFAVIIFSIVMNLIISAYERYHGKRLASEVLLAGAAEARTDLLISLSVLFGLAATALGYPWLDTLVALVIVGLIMLTAYTILRKTSLILTDAVAVNPEEITRIAASVAGVEHVLRVRSRGTADAIYADIDLQVEPATTADHTAAIAHEIETRVKALFNGVTEVNVYFAPFREQKADAALVARAAADALGMTVHEVTEILMGDKIGIEMHVEVVPTLTLDEAHRRVTELEKRVTTDLPDVREVVTHIEPSGGQPGAVLHSSQSVAYSEQALTIAHALYPNANWHAPTIRPVAGGFAMTLHCWLPGSMSIQEAHSLAEHVETQIRATLPQVQRVTIHTEPPEAGQSDQSVVV